MNKSSARITTTTKEFVCTECYSKTIHQGITCSSCKRPICSRCTQKNHARAAENSFYIKYKNYCDTCIWFDIG